jgi:subtilisin family serine protease
VIDSGIAFTHPDLTNNQWANQFPSAEGDLHGWDFVANNGEIKDEQGHGTAVAGIIAAEGNNSVGITGVMWRAGLMSLRVLDNTGTGDVGNAVEAIDYAVAHGAQVINLSWGTTGESIALKEAMLQRLEEMRPA